MDLNALYNLKTKYNFNPISILDIGANNGYFADMCKSVWTYTAIFLIEANPEWENTLKSKNYDYLISLLGTESGYDVAFYRDKNDKTSTGCSIYKELSHFFNSAEEIKLPMNKLDDVVEGSFDFIKMDTQGSELDIIKGGLDTISKCKYLLLEVSLINTNENAPLKYDIINYLKTIQFEEVDVLFNHYDKGILTQQDVLFKHI